MEREIEIVEERRKNMCSKSDLIDLPPNAHHNELQTREGGYFSKIGPIGRHRGSAEPWWVQLATNFFPRPTKS